MNDTINSKQKEDPIISEDTGSNQKNSSSLIDSLFFSSATIVIVGAVFLITMFISGWYIFTLKDRETELIRAQEWVNAHESIILSAKENQEKLNILKKEVAEMESKKNILTIELQDKKEDLRVVENDYVKLNKEADIKRTELDVLQKNIADDDVKIAALKKEIPSLEQFLASLSSKNTNFKSKVDNKRAELKKLEGEINILNGQILAQTKNLKTINDVSSDFSIVQKRLDDAAKKIELSQKKNSESMQSQISILEKHSQIIAEHSSELERVNSLLKNEETNIKGLNKNLKKELDDLIISGNEIKSTSESFYDISRKYQDSEKTMENVINSISETLSDISRKYQDSEKDLKKTTISIGISSEEFSKNLKNISESLRSLTEKYRRSTSDLDQLNDLMKESESVIKTIKLLDLQAESFGKAIDDKSIRQVKNDLRLISDELIEIKEKIRILKTQNINNE